MAAKKKTAPKKASGKKARGKGKPSAIPMPSLVREAGSAALSSFEERFLEGGADGLGLDDSKTKLLNGESGMQKTVRLSGEEGRFRATVKVTFREIKSGR